jgi:hypothetical protein
MILVTGANGHVGAPSLRAAATSEKARKAHIEEHGKK